jgi:hypothetical protein
VLVCKAVLAATNDACGVSGNGLCKLALLELGVLENEGICDTALSSRVMLELVWKLELAVDQSPEDSPEVRPGGSLDTWLLLNPEDAKVVEICSGSYN